MSHLPGTFRLGDLGWGSTSVIYSFINFTFIENLLWARLGQARRCNGMPSLSPGELRVFWG